MLKCCGGRGGGVRAGVRDNKEKKDESKRSPEQVVVFAEVMPKLK